MTRRVQAQHSCNSAGSLRNRSPPPPPPPPRLLRLPLLRRPRILQRRKRKARRSREDPTRQGRRSRRRRARSPAAAAGRGAAPRRRRCPVPSCSTRKGKVGWLTQWKLLSRGAAVLRRLQHHKTKYKTQTTPKVVMFNESLSQVAVTGNRERFLPCSVRTVVPSLLTCPKSNNLQFKKMYTFS